MTASRSLTRRLAPALALVALAAGGCGPPRHPVSGRVVFEDGSPLAEGSVVGETTIDGKTVMARGTVGPDGAFAWGTDKPGDGARPGKYRVIVLPRTLGDAEIAQGALPAVDPKFGNPDTSGIEVEIKEGKNELKITVAKPPPKPAEPEPGPDPEPKKDPEVKNDPGAKKDSEPKKDAEPGKNPEVKKDPKPEVAPEPKPAPTPGKATPK